jgi:hypothetical protein
MGTTTMLDILGSMIIGGLLLITALQMNDTATNNNFVTQEDLTVQQNLTSLVENIEYDFRKIGYIKGGYPPPTDKCIIFGDSDSIAFLSDIDNDGELDTVIWYKENGPIAGCPNQNARMLVRETVTPEGVSVDSANLGVTEFSIRYYDAFGTQIWPEYKQGSPDPPNLMKLNLMVEPTSAYDTSYSTNFAFWTQTRLVSKNLTAR